MPEKYKVAIVNYLNTKPFIEGIRSHPICDLIELIECSPAKCASLYLEHEVDISLVPVGALIGQPFERISDYGIASDGPVSSVCLFSQVPLEEIKTIYLDYQSRTSVMLVRLLSQEYWHIRPNFVQASAGYEQNLSGAEAGLIIGDRALKVKHKYPYVYDLGEAWQSMTGLPFVYAVWLAREETDLDFLKAFNEALSSGVESIPTQVSQWNGPEGCDLLNYFAQNIRYKLDPSYDEGLKTFLRLIEEKVLKGAPAYTEAL